MNRGTPWVTRSWWTWMPRWRSGYEKPVNWMLFKWYDWLPLAVLLLLPELGVLTQSLAGSLLAVWYLLIFPIFFIRRLRARARFCERQGHTPYRPIPEIDEWECLYCGTPIEVKGQTVATSVAMAAAEVDLARHGKEKPQAYWSDRR